MNRNKHSGFSLIELIVVVAIVGIMSVIAMGFYADNVISSNRSEGRAALTAAAGSLEKCKSLFGAYDSANCSLVLPFNSDTGYYQISATAISGTQFTLTAAPIAGTPQDNDADCTSMTLTNTGLKGGAPAVNECW
jgi:type IV pilus assembly protein PilE